MIARQDRRAPLLLVWLAFAPSSAMLVAFFVVFGQLTYSAGEWARHCVADCGDGYRGVALGLGGASLLVVVGGLSARLNPLVAADNRGARLFLQGWEAAVGGIGVLWLLTALLVPIGLFTIPVGLLVLSVAGALRRRLREEAPLRTHLRGFQPLDFLPRYGPYVVTALVLLDQPRVPVARFPPTTGLAPGGSDRADPGPSHDCQPSGLMG